MLADKVDEDVARFLFENDPAQDKNQESFSRYIQILESHRPLPLVRKLEEQLSVESRRREVE